MKHKPKIEDFADYIKPVLVPGHGFNRNDYEWHILAEGDSWFHFNEVRPEENLLQELRFKKPTAILNVAKSSDTIEQMVQSGNHRFFKMALRDYQWNMLLLSAGGNDLIDAICGTYFLNDRVANVFVDGKNSSDANDYINTSELELLFRKVHGFYNTFFDLRDSSEKNANCPVVIHTYDYFTMRDTGNPRDETIRYRALYRNGIPKKLWPAVSKIMNDTLANNLLKLDNPARNIYVINTLGTLQKARSDVAGNTTDWRNEIHPNRNGYARLSLKKVSPFINKLL
jgi:hypothetical protein